VLDYAIDCSVYANICTGTEAFVSLGNLWFLALITVLFVVLCAVLWLTLQQLCLQQAFGASRLCDLSVSPVS
jgi:hypothetical protein